MEPEVTTLSKPETKEDTYHVNSLTRGMYKSLPCRYWEQTGKYNAYKKFKARLMKNSKLDL